MEERVVHILWTGGLESTYRVVELSQTDCIIQPHYIIYKYRGKRESKDYELRAIHKITDILKKDKRTKATILPPIICNFNDENNKTEDYQDIKEAGVILATIKGCVSRQYLMFARYARNENLKLEMGVRFSYHGGIGKAIDTSFLVEHPVYHDVLMIDPEKGQKDWASYTVFKDFLFPKSLFHKEKKDEAGELANNGYGEVLKNVWSCYNPVFGMPCGHCSPCMGAKLEGIGYMIPFWGNFLGAVRLRATKYPRMILRKILPNKLYEMLKVLFHKSHTLMK